MRSSPQPVTAHIEPKYRLYTCSLGGVARPDRVARAADNARARCILPRTIDRICHPPHRPTRAAGSTTPHPATTDEYADLPPDDAGLDFALLRTYTAPAAEEDMIPGLLGHVRHQRRTVPAITALACWAMCLLRENPTAFLARPDRHQWRASSAERSAEHHRTNPSRRRRTGRAGLAGTRTDSLCG